MLDGLLGRGFSSKCKPLMKDTRSRIEVVRKRADAKQRFLKEDLAKLLSNGLDINAYGRTEEFLAGANVLWCYDFVEQSCQYLVKQLSKIEKQDECPEEYREAVASLMFAAARFSDFPELRDLRDAFKQRYGNRLEVFVNQKFVEKLSSRPPEPAKRLQVLHDIAIEFSIKWDSKGFEKRMANPSVLTQVAPQKSDVPKRIPGNHFDAKNRIQNLGDANIVRRDELDHNTAGKREKHDHDKQQLKSTMLTRGDSSFVIDSEMHPARSRNPSNGKVPDNVLTGYMNNPRRGENSETRNKHSYPKQKIDDELKSHVKVPENVHIGYTRHNNGNFNPQKIETPFREKAEFAPNFAAHMGRPNKLEEESDRTKPRSSYALPPPYVKSKDNNIIILPPPYIKPKDEQFNLPAKANSYGREKMLDYEDDRIIPLPPARRSTRRKHHKKDSSRKGLKIMFDEEQHRNDDEEKIIDKLLIHYSKKPTGYDLGKLKKKIPDSGESSIDRDLKYEVVPVPARSVSLPHEQNNSPELKKVFHRSNTFQPDDGARHVHPKLPDYDDLAARFAALKGR